MGARTRSVVVVVVVLACLATLAGCPIDEPPPPAQCPDGQRGDPCAFPWEAECADVDAAGCVAGSPTRCDLGDVSLLPAYDCETCGCSGAEACVPTALDGSLCLSADAREGERSDDVVDDGLEDADYVGLIQLLHGLDALTLADTLQRLQNRRAEDPRRSVVVLGSDEAGLASIVPGFFDGSFGGVVAADTCENLEAGLLPDDGQVLVTAADAATDVTCLHPGVFARCEFPSAAGCAQLAGLLPETLVILGPKTIGDVDNALLRHAARAGRDEWLTRFDAQLGLFSEVFLGTFEARFAHPTLPGTLRFLVAEGLIAEGRDDVVFGLFEDRASAAQLRTFRLMWVDANVQLFLIEHDITPSECTFVVTPPANDDDDDEVDVDCAKNGARVSGHVVLQDNDLSGLTLAAP
ncbi:MAG: hypothetical protein Q8O67_30995 [Deltaproteobacteria bacterium]|nr:hypothetical protein [Deltaproteobacteria bacterium]